MEIQKIRINSIFNATPSRPKDKATIKTLAESIGKLGLLNPITVRRVELTSGLVKEGYAILSGNHRLEAAKALGWSEIDANIIDCDPEDYKTHRLIEITENLHRNDLTALERSKLVAEWVELTNQSAQVEQVESKRADGRGHRPKGGDAEASRQLGLSRGDIQRSKKIANLSPEAQQAAVETGLDRNQSALLSAAKESTPEAQVNALGAHKNGRRTPKFDGSMQYARRAISVLEKINPYTDQRQLDAYHVVLEFLLERIASSMQRGYRRQKPIGETAEKMLGLATEIGLSEEGWTQTVKGKAS
jgi:ParB/RepB/Spo0J family partition protein